MRGSGVVARIVIGTAEPRYADPDRAMADAAAAWLARTDAGRLRTLVTELPGPRNRLHAPHAMAATDALLARDWRGAGWRVGRQRVRLGDIEGMNLVAIAQGASDEAIVVVAHHDTVRDAPGADDNGAGLAILRELAAQLGGRRFERTVILAAPDFEEIGLIGSRHLVRWLRRRYRVSGAVVFDPIGYMDPAPGTQAVPDGIDRLYPGQLARLRARGHAGDTVVALYRRRSLRLVAEWARCMAATVGRERVLMLRDPLDLPLLGPALLALPAARNFSRSDHVPFWRAGLPAIHVTNTANFRNPHYHRPTDTPDTLDYDTLARVTAATGLLVERLASTPGGTMVASGAGHG